MLNQSEEQETIANNFASLMKSAYTTSIKNCMLWDWVSNHLKPSKNQTKCTLYLNFFADFESLITSCNNEKS